MHKLCESPPQPAVAPKSTQREKNDFVNAKMEGQNAKKVPFAIAMPPQPPLPWLFFCHYHFGNYWSHPLAPSPPHASTLPLLHPLYCISALETWRKTGALAEHGQRTERRKRGSESEEWATKRASPEVGWQTGSVQDQHVSCHHPCSVGDQRTKCHWGCTGNTNLTAPSKKKKKDLVHAARGLNSTDI